MVSQVEEWNLYRIRAFVCHLCMCARTVCMHISLKINYHPSTGNVISPELDHVSFLLLGTLFPQVTAMAATGNTSLLYEMGSVMGK